MEKVEKRKTLMSNFCYTNFIEEQLANLNNVSDWIACAAEEYEAQEGATEQLYHLAIIKMNLKDLLNNIKEETIVIK